MLLFFKMNFYWFTLLVILCWLTLPGESRIIPEIVKTPTSAQTVNATFPGVSDSTLEMKNVTTIGKKFVLSLNNGSNLSSNGTEKDKEEEYYIYYPLGIVNGSLAVIGNPVLYKGSDIGRGHHRSKRQIGLNTADALLGGVLGGAFGGLIGGTIYSPLGPLGSAFGGGLGAGIGSALGAGFAGGGPGAFLLGGAAGAAGGSVGGLLLGPTGALVLGLLGGGVGGAIGSIG